MGELAGIIDNTENGMTLDAIMHDLFDICLHPTDILHRYTVHRFRRVPAGMRGRNQFSFPDLLSASQPYVHCALFHSAVAHVLRLSGVAEVIDKVYDAFSDEVLTTSSRNHATEDDFLIRHGKTIPTRSSSIRAGVVAHAVTYLQHLYRK